MLKKRLFSGALCLLLLFSLVSCDLLYDILGLKTIELEALSVSVGANDSITFRILNSGSESVADVEVWLLLSSNDVIDKNDDMISSVYVTVGAQLTESTTVSFDDLELGDIEDGLYYVGIYVDPNNRFDETNETNNTAASLTMLEIDTSIQSSDATLASLSIDHGSLDPQFSSTVTLYDVVVTNDVDTITISAAAVDSGATIVGTGAHSLYVGENTFDVVVTAEDTITTNTYRVVVTREPAAVTDDAKLASLSLGGVSLVPAFDPAVTSYTAAVANEVTVVTVSATANSSSASVSGTGDSTLVVGENVVTVRVTAADEVTSLDYTITITRAPATASNDASLSSLALSVGTLSPDFDSAVLLYTANVGSTVESISVTATATNPSATVTGGGYYNLTVGENTITVNVQAEDGIATSSYIVTVIRATATASSDATLASLALSDATLVPAFSTGITSYSATVANEIEQILVSATATDGNATISGTGTRSLATGVNTIDVVVTAEDGVTESTYSISVTRDLSSDAELSDLTLSDGVLAPGFDAGITSYTATVTNAVATVTIGATASDTAATISGAGEQSLNTGENVLSVVVTAEDGVTEITYTVIITRTYSDDATLSSLSISAGLLTPTFDPGTTEYAASVGNEITDIAVLATSNHGDAIVAGDGTFGLVVGDNVFDVEVTAEDGVTILTYTITVTRLTAAPTVQTATGATIDAGQGVVVSTANLDTTDVDSLDADIVYTLSSIDAGLELRNGGTLLSTGGSFSQADVNNSAITVGNTNYVGGLYDVVLAVTDESGNAAPQSPVSLEFIVNDPPVTLIAEYLFNDGTANDSSGNMLNGTLNATTLGADRFGNPDAAVVFDGNAWIDLGTNALFDFNDAITITGWIKPTSFTNGRIISKRGDDGTGSIGGYEVDLYNAIRLHRHDSVVYNLGSVTGFGVDTWMFFAVTWRPAAPTPNGAIYLGDLDTSPASVAGIYGSDTWNNTTVPLVIGSQASGPPASGFTGAIDDVRIYSGTLPVSDINNLYNETYSVPDPPTNVAVSLGVDSIVVDWTDSVDADTVEVSWSPGGTQTLAAGVGTYTIGSLSADTTYSISVTSLSTEGTPSAPATIEGRTLVMSEALPTNTDPNFDYANLINTYSDLRLVMGNTAYIEKGYDYVWIVDLNTPTSPSIIDAIDTSPQVWNLLDYDTDMVLVERNGNSTRIYDVTDPSTLSSQTPTSFLANGNYAHRSGERLFITDNFGDIFSNVLIKMWDLTDRANPSLISEFDTGIADPDADGNRRIYAWNDLVFVENMSGHGVLVYDISDPANITINGEIADYGGNIYVNNHHVAVFGGDTINVYQNSSGSYSWLAGQTFTNVSIQTFTQYTYFVLDESVDGFTLFFIDDNQLMKIRFNAGANDFTLSTRELQNSFTSPRYYVDDQYIYMMDTISNVVRMEMIDKAVLTQF